MFSITDMPGKKGIVAVSSYSNGNTKECIVNSYYEINTPFGVLVPQYEDDALRRKNNQSVSFYPEGQLKSIALQEQTRLQTPAGEFPAELITFYKSGNIKRLFLLNGKISGYWTEEDEYGLAADYQFNFSFASFKAKIISIYFYESGAIKSITLWPGEIVKVNSHLGIIKARIGISLYPDGRLKSLEPAEMTEILTPIGNIFAFDAQAHGIHGDTNSLCFEQSGELSRLATSTDIVSFRTPDGKKLTYGPSMEASMIHPGENEIIPLSVSFERGFINFNNSKDMFEIHGNSYSIKHIPGLLDHRCGSCAECGRCT